MVNTRILEAVLSQNVAKSPTSQNYKNGNSGNLNPNSVLRNQGRSRSRKALARGIAAKQDLDNRTVSGGGSNFEALHFT